MTRAEYEDGVFAFLAKLKALGVSKWRGQTEELLNPIEVDFFPVAIDSALPTALGSPSSLAQALAESDITDKCACGHTEAAHNPEGECLQGCDLEVCYPGKDTSPQPTPLVES